MSNNLNRARKLVNSAIKFNRAGKYTKAKENCQKALKFTSNLPECWYTLGVSFRNLGRIKQAVDSQLKALNMTLDSFDAQNNIALELYLLGETEKAKYAFLRSIELNSNYALAHSNLGKILADQGEQQSALEHLQRAKSLAPENALIRLNLAAVLNKIGYYVEAEHELKPILKMGHASLEAFNNLGNALSNQEKYKEAEECFINALELDPLSADAHLNLFHALNGLNRPEEALRHLHKSLELNPDQADARYNLGILKLSALDFKNGWQEYEYRSRDFIEFSKDEPRDWDGLLTKNTYLLVLAEQGIGDEVLYASFLQHLNNNQCHSHIHVTADSRLIPIFERTFANLNFSDRKALIPSYNFTDKIHLASLGAFYLNALEDFSRITHPFLKYDQKRSQQLHDKLKRKNQLICGISWQSKNKKIGSSKTLKLTELEPVLSLPHLDIVNLQYGDTESEIQNFEVKTGISIQTVKEIDNLNDIDGLLSLISACDIVVTTSNVTAHLAGSIGKRVFLILPVGNGKLWYWFHRDENNQSRWYPSVTIFEQKEVGEWSYPISSICTTIKNLTCEDDG